MCSVGQGWQWVNLRILGEGVFPRVKFESFILFNIICIIPGQHFSSF